MHYENHEARVASSGNTDSGGTIGASRSVEQPLERRREENGDGGSEDAALRAFCGISDEVLRLFLMEAGGQQMERLSPVFYRA
jgi:hypothetical protein